MNNRFRYSSLEKGKKAQSARLRNKGLAVQTEPTSSIPVGEFSEHTEPIISVSGGPTIKMSSIQSSPSKQNSNLKNKPSSSKVIPPPQAPSNSLIFLRPQVPSPKLGILGHDKHKVGRVSDLQGTSELDDPFEGTEYSDRRGCN